MQSFPYRSPKLLLPLAQAIKVFVNLHERYVEVIYCVCKLQKINYRMCVCVCVWVCCLIVLLYIYKSYSFCHSMIKSCFVPD